MEVLLILALLIIYLLPTIVAISRNHRNQAGIMLLNIIFGWTILVWFGSLIWSVSDNVNPPIKKTE